MKEYDLTIYFTSSEFAILINYANKQAIKFIQSGPSSAKELVLSN